MDLRSGCAFWIIKNGLLASYPPLTDDASAEVAVIGAGVTGALVACELTRAGADVVVLDRRDVASGSTAASTGLLQYETDTSLEELAERIGLAGAVRVYRLGLEAIDRIEALCGEVGDPSGFARRACLYLASSRRDARVLTREHALRVANGFDVEWLSAAELRTRFAMEEAHGALYARGDGEIDTYRFTHRLLGKAVERGARVFDRTEVTKVRRGDIGFELATARGPRVRARRLVYASGYETTDRFTVPPARSLGRHPAAIRSLTTLTSTFACATEPVASFDGWQDRCVIWETARPYTYLRTTEDHRIVVGGEDERISTRHQSERVLQKKRERLMKRLRAKFPRIEAEPAYVWGGVFAVTRDTLPFIGARPGEPDVMYALGYGANGITFAAIAAALLRDQYLGRANEDARLFAFDRE